MASVTRSPDQIIDRPMDDKAFRELCDQSNNSNDRTNPWKNKIGERRAWLGKRKSCSEN